MATPRQSVGTPAAANYFLGRPTYERSEISLTARKAMPGYAGHRPNYMKGKSSPAHSDSGSDAGSPTGGYPTRNGGSPTGGYPTNASRRSLSTGDLKATSRSSPVMRGANVSGMVSEKCTKAIPGYVGHIPGLKANNYHGSTWKNNAQSSVTEYRQPPPPETPLAKEKFHQRALIPGYRGHQPGVRSDNLHGVSPHKAAKEGWLQENRKKELGGGLVAVG